jgi:glycosyltransferase involved in cell wall biosynthesis
LIALLKPESFSPTISIIVPVYNVEKYIKRCVFSILHQSIKNIEIILVDDGSTDCSGVICNHLREQYASIKVIHQKNGGVSSARNAGIHLATGKYIGFVDADDWCESDMYDFLYQLAIKHHADIAMCSFIFEKDNGCKRVESHLNAPKMELTVEEGLLSISGSRKYEKASYCVWNKLFRKSLIDDHHIRFPEQVIVAEDACFLTECILKAKKIVYDPIPKYHYCQNKYSALNSTKNTHIFNESKLVQIQVLYHLGRIVDERYPKAARNIKANVCSSAIILLRDYIISKNKKPTIKKILLTAIRKNLIYLLRSDVGDAKMITLALLVSVNPIAFYLLCQYKYKFGRPVSVESN